MTNSENLKKLADLAMRGEAIEEVVANFSWTTFDSRVGFLNFFNLVSGNKPIDFVGFSCPSQRLWIYFLIDDSVYKVEYFDRRGVTVYEMQFPDEDACEG